MVLLPLATLLLLSRPSRFVPWIFTGIAVTVAVWWLILPGGLSDQTAKAWTLIASTLFAVYVLGQERPAVDSAIGGSLFAAVAVLSWYVVLRIPPTAVITEAQHGLWQLYRLMGDAAPAYRRTMTDAADAAGGFTVILPGVMVLAGMSGLLVAWRWYHIVAEAPVGAPPGRFREFRFNDHLVWLLALGLGGLVAQTMGILPHVDLWPTNILIVAGGLYWARGAAVAVSLSGDRWPRLLLGPAIPILFLTQFVVPGLAGVGAALTTLIFFASLLFLGVGVADTWLDFRRRAATASGE
jgi:hypothetical protein